MQEISGRPTIHPALFITGKAGGFFTWGILFLAMAGIGNLHQQTGNELDYVAVALLSAGTLLTLLSSITLGSSIRIGLPTEKTILRTAGIYRYSRNPMYLGVHMVTLAAMVYTLKWWVILPGFFSIYVYHLIVKGEERFLEERFGATYQRYAQKTRRYM